MELKEIIDIQYDQIEGQKQKLSEDHYMNPEQEDELEELIASAIKFGELCAQRDSATPEGFFLVPKKLSDEMNDHLWDFMTDNFISTNEDGDSYIACDDFDLRKFYSEIIEAQEQSHD